MRIPRKRLFLIRNLIAGVNWLGEMDVICRKPPFWATLSDSASIFLSQVGRLFIKYLVSITFKISKSTGRSVGIVFFSFFIVPNFLNQAQGKPKKAKRLAVICFLIQGHQLHYKPQKTPAEQCFIKLTCSLLFVFGNEANDPTS